MNNSYYNVAFLAARQCAALQRCEEPWNQTVPEDDVIHVFSCICKHANAARKKNSIQPDIACLTKPLLHTHTTHGVFAK